MPWRSGWFQPQAGRSLRWLCSVRCAPARPRLLSRRVDDAAAPAGASSSGPAKRDYLPPETAAWLSATIGQALADGSEVSTGARRAADRRCTRVATSASAPTAASCCRARMETIGWSSGPAGCAIASPSGRREPLRIHTRVARAGAVLRGGRRAGQPPRDRGHRQGGPGPGRHPRWPAPDPDDRRPVGARRRGRRHGAARSVWRPARRCSRSSR